MKLSTHCKLTIIPFSALKFEPILRPNGYILPKKGLVSKNMLVIPPVVVHGGHHLVVHVVPHVVISGHIVVLLLHGGSGG